MKKQKWQTMALSKPNKPSQSDVSVVIDLESLLGKFAQSRDVRETFFELALERLLERTAAGRDVDGKIFAPAKGKSSGYSDAYKNSLAFAAFGKSNKINLELTGDMLSSIGIRDQNSKKMVVAVSDSESAKAYNHTVGDTVPRRPFLGWSDKELERIAKEFEPLVKQSEKSRVSDEQILKLLDRLEDEGIETDVE